jgi:CO/xanthine dehydrogenase FAD-binding subunit
LFKPREYVIASSESEAVELLMKGGDKARIIAGGTGIYEVAHQGLFSDVECLIDISRLNLSYVHLENNSLHIGACTSMTTIFENDELVKLPELGALFDALRAIQPLQVKNVATVGGAICTALPFFDLPVALIALDTEVVLAPNDRSVKLLDFVQGYFAVDLQPGEFVREIRIPLSLESKKIGSSFLKFALTGDDWAIINCGAQLKVDAQDSISEAIVCFGGGIGDKPRRATHLEGLLVGRNWSDEKGLKEILEHLATELETVTDLKASSKYRMHLAKVLARRSITQAALRIRAI